MKLLVDVWCAVQTVAVCIIDNSQNVAVGAIGVLLNYYVSICVVLSSAADLLSLSDTGYGTALKAFVVVAVYSDVNAILIHLVGAGDNVIALENDMTLRLSLDTGNCNCFDANIAVLDSDELVAIVAVYQYRTLSQSTMTYLAVGLQNYVLRTVPSLEYGRLIVVLAVLGVVRISSQVSVAVIRASAANLSGTSGDNQNASRLNAVGLLGSVSDYVAQAACTNLQVVDGLASSNLNVLVNTGGTSNCIVHVDNNCIIADQELAAVNLVLRVNSASRNVRSGIIASHVAKTQSLQGVSAVAASRVGEQVVNSGTDKGSLIKQIYIGDYIFEDLNNDGVIDEKDQTFLGSPLPKFTYGINNTFNYKNFDLTIFLYGSYGNKAMNYLSRRITNPNSSGNVHASVANHARLGYLDGNSDNTDVWNMYILPGSNGLCRMSVNDANDNDRISSRYVEDASFLRIQNIALGYTLPKNWLKKLKIENARIYANIKNVYTFTGYDGYDPEIGSTQAQYSYSGQSMLMYGVDTGRCPSPRIYTFGIDLTF